MYDTDVFMDREVNRYKEEDVSFVSTVALIYHNKANDKNSDTNTNLNVKENSIFELLLMEYKLKQP